MNDVSAHAQTLFGAAMQVALLIAMPVIALIACIGVVVGVVQTVVQVQDQNLAFFPKIAAVAWVAAAFGPAALTLLVDLFTAIVHTLPALANT